MIQRPISVLHVITTTDVGGAETQLSHLINATPADLMKHAVVGLTPEGPQADLMRKGKAEVISLELSKNPLNLPLAVFRLAKLVNKYDPEIIQSWMYHADLLAALSNLIGKRRPLLWGVRCSDMDTSHYSASTRIVISICRRLAKLPECIVANSQAGLEHHASLGYPRRKMLVVANGVDTKRFKHDPKARVARRQVLGLSDQDILVGMAARYDPMKDHATFLKAADLVAAKYPQAQFVLLGKGVDNSNPNLSTSGYSHINGKVHLLGQQSDVPGWMSAMDINVCSSAFGEGFSNSISEAMSVGLPQVVTDVGDNRLLVGDCGLVVPPSQAGILAERIMEWCEMPEEIRIKSGLQARDRIKENYSRQKMVHAYHDLYQGLVG